MTAIAPPRLAAPPPEAHKFSRGLVFVVGGAMAGAGELAASAALRAGAGYVVLATPSLSAGPPHALVRRAAPLPTELEQPLADPRIGAIVVGPGLGRDGDARARLSRALAAPAPVIVDGDALSLLPPDLGASRRPVWLTPHAGEFDRLFPDLAGDKIERTLAAARRTGATVVHKGAQTVVARPDGAIATLSDASSWLSTAGTGDVLAGILAAQVAAGVPDPAAAAVWLHARAAALAGPAFAADDLIPLVPRAIAECLS